MCISNSKLILGTLLHRNLLNVQSSIMIPMFQFVYPTHLFSLFKNNLFHFNFPYNRLDNKIKRILWYLQPIFSLKPQDLKNLTSSKQIKTEGVTYLTINVEQEHFLSRNIEVKW